MNRLMPHAAEKQGARASPHSILSKRVAWQIKLLRVLSSNYIFY